MDTTERKTLAKAVAVKIKPVFDQLSSNALLERCVDGFTQNAAESFNSVSWNLCPKRTFVGSTTVDLCAGLAVITYNDGHQKLEEVFLELGMKTGIHSNAFLKNQDKQRVQLSVKRASDAEKRIRQAKRKLRRETEDIAAEKEGKTYENGGF